MLFCGKKISGSAATKSGLPIFPLLWIYGITITFLLLYALVDIVIRFFDTDLSLLKHFPVIEVKRKEVVTVTSVRYSCKNLKTSKMKDVNVSVQRDELTPYGEQNLQSINAG